ncbi:NAD(P)H-binding protein [Actinomadura sp. NEAU-AAG7]|uniref:NmrA family NAD(P)-binding protein n=1 Tax=Actinomadura sp. NEAU-AAG7 TaxID=2839640 RepID=UPI001BE41EFE|nr:NAD(P)H-binding protein [Actinomadura sp. NEAU-AAG7]MBT2212016.1 NAD(P)H-binding protein [Actinomadura sp. NEAU-AAG7]
MILVIGATGNVGRHVLSQLQAVGADGVRALVRPDEAAEADLPAGVEVAVGDLKDAPGLEAALTGVETVFLVWPMLTTEGAREVLEAIARHARHVVYLSSIGVGGRPEERHDPIFTLHAGMEALVAEFGPSHTVLRADTIASNTLGWADQIRTTGTVRGPLMPATAVIDPRDIAAVAARVLTGDAHRGATHRLTGPEVIGPPEQVRAIGAAVGRELRFEEVPVERARERMLADGRPPVLVDALLGAAEIRAASTLVTSTVADITGEPARTFQRWAEDHRDSFR